MVCLNLIASFQVLWFPTRGVELGEEEMPGGVTRKRTGAVCGL